MKKSGGFFSSKAAAFLSLAATTPARQYVYSSGAAVPQQRQPCSKLSPTCQSRCMCGWCTGAGGDRTTTKKVSPPIQQHETHAVRPHARYTKHTAAAKKAAAHTYHWNACVPPFRLATPPGYQVNPTPKGNLVQPIYIYPVSPRPSTTPLASPYIYGT